MDKAPDQSNATSTPFMSTIKKPSLNTVFILLVMLLTVLAVSLASWDYLRTNKFILETVRHLAWESLNRDIAYQHWATIHEERHITIPSLNLLNSHHGQLRQKNARHPSRNQLIVDYRPDITQNAIDLVEMEDGMKAHITSMNPINAQNAPNHWEKEALSALASGMKEVSGLDDTDQITYFRFMRPLMTEQRCLSCHGEKGFQPGQILGGISISIPWALLKNLFAIEFRSHLITYSCLLTFGIICLWFGRHSLAQYLYQRQQAETALKKLVVEKEVLLKEVHHRVKNNMAAIIGLLDMQMENISDNTVLESLSELNSRIRSMALVHEQIYQSTDFSRINFHEYLETLVDHLCSSYDRTGYVQCHVSAEGMEMELDSAVPCGMLITELVTNALKYAFPKNSFHQHAGCCEIFVSVKWEGSSYIVTVSDNGIGLPPGIDWKNPDTLGLTLVKMWGEHQLQGRMELEQASGTTFRLRFAPNKRK